MRGMPLTDLLISHSPRGFYVTKSTTDSSTTNVLGRTETVDLLTTDVTTVPTEERITTIAMNMDGEENGQIVDKVSPEETTTNWESDSSTSTTSLDLETEGQQGSSIATAPSLETEYVDDTSPEDSKTSSTINRIATTASAAMNVSSSDSSAEAQSVSTFSTKPPTTLSFSSSTRPLPIATTRSRASINVSTTTISSITPTNATESKIPSTSSSTARTTSVTSEIPASKDLISTSSMMDFKIPDDSPIIESSPSTIVDAEKTDEISTLAMPTDIDVSSTTISSITPTNTTKTEIPPTSSSTARTTSVTSEIPASKDLTSTSSPMDLKTPDNSLIVDASPSTIVDAERTDKISTPAMSTDINVVDRTNVTAREDTKTTINIPGTKENSAQDKENESIVEALRSTVPSTFAESSTTSVRAKSNVRRRQRIRVNATNDEFGRKKPGRTSLDRRVADKRPAEEETTTRILDEVPRPYPRRRITVYRGRHRAANATRTSFSTSTILNDVPKPPNLSNSRGRPRTRVVLKRVKSKSAEARTSTKNEEERMIGKESVVEDGRLRDSIPSEENSDRTVAEVNSPKSAGQPSRAGGSQSTSRFRKTNSSTSTAQVQNKSANAVTSLRKNRPADATLTTTIIEVLDSKEGTTEATEKDIDQSSRAQELAVTLADPPSAQSITGTGRLPLRDVLRRKISTTVVPKTEPTTSRTTLRFTTVQRNRQRSKPKDKPLQKVPTRPRRPSVIDYDYYEDEEEPVVRKTTLNEKLFLTSKGTIRCLDQGNFPHPYSCKKFITCARMVNGQVTGAEYTCPDKLSFDPVGGICNWSAGLGCKE